MTLTMPQGLQDLASVVVGADFPEGDEDALRRLGDAWAACAAEVEEVLGDTQAAAKDVLSTMEGATADAFKEFTEKLTASDAPDAATLQQLQELCEQLGDGCDDLALEVEYSKASIIAALVVLFAQIALMLAMAVLTFGASSAGIPAAQAATQAVVRGVIEALKQAVIKIVQEVGKQLAIQIPANMAANLLVDFTIQADQMRKGDREEWDASKTQGAALTGLANGIGAGVTGGALGGAARGLANKLGTKVGDEFGDTVGGRVQWGGQLFGGAAVGAAGGAAGASMGSAFNEDEQSEQGLGAGAFGGVAGGVGGAGKGYKTALDEYESRPWQSWEGEPPKNTDVTDLVGPPKSNWESWDGEPPKNTDVTDLVGPPKPGWESWDGEPPKNTDVTDLVGPKSNWQSWDGEPPKDTDVTDLVGPADKPEPTPNDNTETPSGQTTPAERPSFHVPGSDRIEGMLPGEVPMPGPVPPEDVEMDDKGK